MEPIPNQSPNTSSLSEAPVLPKLTYDVKGDTRLITILYKTVEGLKDKVHDLETKKIIDETQLPPELLRQNGLLPVKGRLLKRGRGSRPLLQSEIEEAKQHSVFAVGQARWLGVNFKTYKRWSQIYGIYKSNQSAKGKKWVRDPERGKYPLSRILSGEFNDNPRVTDWMVKCKLINGNVFPYQCNICGYDKKRIVDGRVGVLLDHKDGNLRNFCKDNLQFLCFNCMWECGKGYIHNGKHFFDPSVKVAI